jgi:hypothetical protein
MVLNRVCFAAFGAMIFAWSGLSVAQQYRPGEYLNLDLSRAVLSPKPLGPAASFAPGPLDVTVDRGNAAAQASAELVVDPKPVPTATVRIESNSSSRNLPSRNFTSKNFTSKNLTSKNLTSKTALRTVVSGWRSAHASAERSAPHKPHALIALHGRNPAEAQARDTAVQTWPCKSGGICNWKR